MTKQMRLKDGPLDGERQVVLDLNTTVGWQMRFDLPNYQTFAPDNQTPIQLGLVAIYALTGPGPPPNPGAPDYDTWDTSWVYEFQEEVWVPRPPIITPPVPPQLPPAVIMVVGSTLTVNADDPSPGVQMVGEGDMEVDAIATSVDYATVAMVGETSLSVVRQDFDTHIIMAASGSLTVTGLVNGQ